MSKTLEEIALQVAEGMPKGFLWADGALHDDSGVSGADVVEFARRLVAALGAQEPVGKVVLWSPLHGIFTVSQRHETNSFPNPLKYGVVYAAPVVNPDWQMVPKEPTPEMIVAAKNLDWGNSDVGGSCINQWQVMLCVAPEYKP